MKSLAFSTVALLSTFLPTVFAQTHTDCNPLNTTGCPNMPALGGNTTFQFNDTMSETIWTKKNQGTVKWTDQGTTFTVERRGDSPTVESSFYLFFGRVSIIMKSAPGVGIVSSAILQSECLDEIDWEFLGSKPTEVLTNYFGKGNTTDYTRGKDFNSSNAEDQFHNYTIDWTKDRTQWWVDDKMLRELKYEDALGGKNYPQTPMNIRLGIWSGGDVQNNDKYTVEWAGGETNFDDGPFTMTVQEVYAQDYTSAKEYSWANMDASGDWQKVKVIEGKSATLEEVEKPHGVKNRWAALSKGARVAIVASVLGSIAIGACIIAFCCIKQRRAGRRELLADEAQRNKESSDLLQYKQQTVGGRSGYGRI